LRALRKERHLKMGNSPKDNLARLLQILNAWEKIASAKTFGGKTAPEFRVIVERSIAARSRIDDLDQQMTQAITERENADTAALDTAKLIANGVRADPTEGENSALYEGMGYTRASERKSGLHRTKGTGPKSGSDKPKT
jgi:hypothetical protein